ncbi:cyclin-domain-containing protein [Aspergillus steynii IBT 23096]|uniref:Cyclin-domain-containing protein n=1 Tax=Aspergillus steynii IBT 23096 TaxID=1392250 RepID=A0A2I2FXR3_9EURO|nr:cyclin-domain-containing protein [Aspergillus steynii IBT 23096]PLB45424.1 cyclin-domain-containing protein [Aspergillus steynii IBT 23096]
MLVSSPSPSALRPSSSPSSRPPRSSSFSSPSFPRPPVASASSTAAVPTTAAPGYHHHPHQHYEPATHPTAASSGSPLSRRSSRVAIEELRSALTRHTVASTSSGPSGDLPGGRSAGLTTLGGGTIASSNAAGHTDTVVPCPQPPCSSDRPTNNGAAPHPSAPDSAAPSSSDPPMTAPVRNGAGNSAGSNKRNSPNDPVANGAHTAGLAGSDLEGSQTKRLRPSKPAVKVLPAQYEEADPRDIVILISSMLMELIRFNDKIPLHQGRLTRFHSRTPPRISVQDYLQRLATHATLSPPILLSMVYYIDRLCALYPSFTVSSLTIHRFLIASATVASKGLSDSFWTNKTYARVGGISMTELALLELEFLFRVEWRIVPQPEVLVDYYQSLVERCEGFEIQRDG